MVRVILADSNELIRIGLRTTLNAYEEVEIAGEAIDSESLLTQVETFKPDVVLIDYSSPGFSIDVIPAALELNKQTKFVAITSAQSGQTIVDALRSGVVSHIKKDCDLMEIVDSVRDTAAGQSFFCGKILEKIAEENINVDDIHLEAFSCAPVSISERENEVICMIAEGHTNGQIAEKLFISNHTVNTHRKNIMHKLGVKNTAGIVMYAVKSNLVSPNKYLFAAQPQS